MEIKIQREPTYEGTTIGLLHLDGSVWCYTLEDAVRTRDVDGDGDIDAIDVATFKAPKRTAIPAGRYRLVFSPSLAAREGKLWCPASEISPRPHDGAFVLPELLSVPGFTGVRIHAGNTATDTAACVLVGFTRLSRVRIGESRDALRQFMQVVEPHLGASWVEIVDAV